MSEKTKNNSEQDGLQLKPHTLTVLFVSLLFLIQQTFFREPTQNDVLVGIASACVSFLIFSFLQFDDDLYFRRPHPALWRVVRGVAILYLMALVFLLFQSPDDGRRLFKYLDPALGEPLGERSYADDCRIFTPENNVSQYYNLMSAVKDEFFIGHLLGWFSKTLIFRDVYMASFCSVLFEVYEYSLEHILHNFKECWWDHWILDVAFCNALGIFLGLLALRYFSAKEFQWVGVSENRTSSDKIKRIIAVFTPFSWAPFHWDVLSSPRRWIGFLTMIILWSLCELNCFFLKYVLWHPPPHPLVIGRMVMWGFFSLTSVRQIYEFISNDNPGKIGPMAWLSLANIGLEVLVILKYSKGQFEHVTGHPSIVVIPWAICGIALVVFTVLYFYVFKFHEKKTQQQKKVKTN